MANIPNLGPKQTKTYGELVASIQLWATELNPTDPLVLRRLEAIEETASTLRSMLVQASA